MSGEDLLSPRQVAEREAARQAVMLLFGVAGALLVMVIHKRLLREFMPAAGEIRMREAKARERRYGRAAVWLWRLDLLQLARKAELRSAAARSEYEGLLP